MLRTPAPLIGDVRRSERKEENVTLSIMATIVLARRPERNARVLSTLGEPGGGRAPEAFALARLALSAVGERAGLGSVTK